jgi:hypothetical protein
VEYVAFIRETNAYIILVGEADGEDLLEDLAIKHVSVV